MSTFLVFVPCIVGIVLQLSFTISDYHKKYVKAVILKGLAASTFVLTAFLGWFLYNHGSFGLLVFVGSLFGMAGDIILNLRFIFKDKETKLFVIGATSFLIGHIFYIAALAPKVVNLVPCIVIILILVAAWSLYFFKTTDPAGGNLMKAFGGIYLLALLTMMVTALDVAIAIPTARSIIFGVGAVFFATSDIMLIMHNFGGRNHYMFKIVYLIIYYFAQISIALSLFFH